MKLLTVAEMSELLRITKQTFNRLVKRRSLPFYDVGRARMFNPDKVLSILESYELEAAANVKIKNHYQPDGDFAEFYKELGLR